MVKQLLLASAIALVAGCSGSSNDPVPTTPVPQGPPGNPGQPSGSTAGTWSGPGDFGQSIYIIDSAQNLYGFSSDGAGKFKSLFGVITAPIERFDHRISDNPALGDAFTIVGDRDENFPTVSYSFTVSADGTTLTNTSDFGSFSMSVAASNPITIAEVVGNWQSKTSFCPTCPLELNISVAAGGDLTGNTSFGLEGDLVAANSIELTGNVTEAGQFLGVQFTWNGLTRTGVIYRDVGTQKIVLNSFGFESAEDGNKAFSALLTKVQ